MSIVIVEQPDYNLKGTDSLDSIEKDYALVNAHFTSEETLSCPLDKSMLYSSAFGVFSCLPLRSNHNVGLTMQMEDKGNEVKESAEPSGGSIKYFADRGSRAICTTSSNIVSVVIQIHS